jgi:hypothetical protein
VLQLDEVAKTQSGVLTRAQALAGGLTAGVVRANLAAGRWRRIHPGVYAIFSGPLPRQALLWAAVLRAGPGAVLSHETAAELSGLAQSPSRRIHVTVPVNSSPAPIDGVVIHRSIHAKESRHPARTPPQTRTEHTVLDLTQTARHIDDAISWLARAIGGRLTTPGRLSTLLSRRRKLRWRPVLRAALDDVAAGCHSLIELKYLRDVERAHGLPRSQRQVRRETPTRYDDVRYREFRTRVELDGRAAHPEHERWRDMRRDNAAVEEGDRVLRYGLGDIESYACQVAAQVSRVLQSAGWHLAPHPCSHPGCPFA